MEETAVRLVLGRHSGSVLLGRKAVKVIGIPRPSLGILNSPLLQESEITIGHLPIILQVLGSIMALMSTLLTCMEQRPSNALSSLRILRRGSPCARRQISSVF